MEKITSQNNSQIKFLQSLRQRKYRHRYRQFILEGVLLLEEALKARMEFLAIYVSTPFLQGNNQNLLLRIEKLGLPIFELPLLLFHKVSQLETPQDILAIVKFPHFQLEKAFVRKVLVVDKVQDPGNLGTMIRTGGAAGCDGIILIKGSVDPFSLKVVRGSMGTLFYLPLLFFLEEEEAISFLEDRGFMLVVADGRGEPFYSISYQKPVALVVGNEGRGVAQSFFQKAEAVAAVPLAERVDSLNVSLAAGIILYEIHRQGAMEKK